MCRYWPEITEKQGTPPGIQPPPANSLFSARMPTPSFKEDTSLSLPENYFTSALALFTYLESFSRYRDHYTPLTKSSVSPKCFISPFLCLHLILVFPFSSFSFFFFFPSTAPHIIHHNHKTFICASDQLEDPHGRP